MSNVEEWQKDQALGDRIEREEKQKQEEKNKLRSGIKRLVREFKRIPDNLRTGAVKDKFIDDVIYLHKKYPS
jgi:hypothetical protein